MNAILSRAGTYVTVIMEINWRAVLTGFVVAIALGVLISVAGPLTETSVYLLAMPGLVGGFVAGYMVSGVGNGAVHGALATIVGALALLAVLTVRTSNWCQRRPTRRPATPRSARSTPCPGSTSPT